MPTGASHPDVPELLRGCWQRSWIRYADGSIDDTSTVVWLQLESLMVDVRVPAGHAELIDRRSLAGCSLDDLRRLAASESSSARTLCTPIVADDDGVRRATAEWFGGEHEVASQPITAFPEPGLLEWDADATTMIERAPSGAYVEQWRRLPGTDAPLRHCVLDGHRQVYITGAVAVLVRDRAVPLSRAERLGALVAEVGDDRQALEALVDCEFSLAQLLDDVYVITASTHPWRTGDVIDVAV